MNIRRVVRIELHGNKAGIWAILDNGDILQGVQSFNAESEGAGIKTVGLSVLVFPEGEKSNGLRGIRASLVPSACLGRMDKTEGAMGR